MWRHDAVYELRSMVNLAFALGLALLCLDCAATRQAPGVGGSATGAPYAMGKLESDLKQPLPAVRLAAIEGLKSLDLPVLYDKEDQLAARLEAEFSDEKHVWIDLKSLGEAETRITIRVGVFGDEERSRKILEAIQRQLS